MGQEKANTITHSIEGRDARVYLTHTITFDVANLIMLGTPNVGGLYADSNFFDKFIPVVLDVTSNAAAVH